MHTDPWGIGLFFFFWLSSSSSIALTTYLAFMRTHQIWCSGIQHYFSDSFSVARVHDLTCTTSNADLSGTICPLAVSSLFLLGSCTFLFCSSSPYLRINPQWHILSCPFLEPYNESFIWLLCVLFLFFWLPAEWLNWAYFKMFSHLHNLTFVAFVFSTIAYCR